MELAQGSFTVEYVEPTTGLPRQWVLSFFAGGEVSLYDARLKKMFLKRCSPPENVSLADITPGATVVICSRPLRVVDCADVVTRRAFAARGASLVLVLPHAYASAGKVLHLLHGAGLGVGRVRVVRFSREDAAAFAGASAAAGGAPVTDAAIATLSADHMLAVECAGDDIVARVHAAVGPTDPAAARAAAPSSVRAILGVDRERSVVRASACAAAAAAEIAYVWGVGSAPAAAPPPSATSLCTHCSAVIIKPHAVVAGHAGALLDALLGAGLEVSALRSIALSRADAADFLAPYKGVCAEAEQWVAELSSGPCIAIEVRGEDAVTRVRELAGPSDIAVARILRPDTLRARYGVDNVRSALHVTDVDVDGPLECRFLFHVL